MQKKWAANWWRNDNWASFWWWICQDGDGDGLVEMVISQAAQPTPKESGGDPV